MEYYIKIKHNKIYDAYDFIKEYGIDKWEELEEYAKKDLTDKKINKIVKQSKNKIQKAFDIYNQRKHVVDQLAKKVNKQLFLLILVENETVIACGTSDAIWKKNKTITKPSLFQSELIRLKIIINTII